MADDQDEIKSEENGAPEAGAQEPSAEGTTEEAPSASDAPTPEAGGGEGAEEEDPWGAAMAEQEAGEDSAQAPAAAEPEPEPESVAVETHRPAATFGELKAEASGKGISNLELILDIPVTISVELGRTQLFIKDLISLGQGAVIELDKLAGDPMEIFVNGHLVAKGETVVVNDKFGIKLTDVVSPTERISNLS